MKYFFALIILITPLTSFAQYAGYSRTPSGSGGYDTIELHISGLDEELYNSNCVNGYGSNGLTFSAIGISGYWRSTEVIPFSTDIIATIQFDIDPLLNSGFRDLPVTQFFLDCENGDFGTFALLEYNDGNVVFTAVDWPAPAPESNSIFGTSSSVMIGNIVNGVQETSGILLPALTLVGVPVAFVVGRGLVMFIRAMI